MRELILGMSMSLDGFVSGPKGEIDWVFNGDEEAIAWKVENSWNASLIIMGSRSFQEMAPFWPINHFARRTFGQKQTYVPTGTGGASCKA
jgi:dihydrofolate reductase